MKLEIHVDERFTGLKPLEEKLDSRISPQLKAEFVNQNTKGVKNFLLDLSEVKYVDSSGLSAILTANRLCSQSEGLMVISGINPHVSKLIEISQLNEVLTILPTVNEAKEAIFMHEIENEIKDSNG